MDNFFFGAGIALFATALGTLVLLIAFYYWLKNSDKDF